MDSGRRGPPGAKVVDLRDKFVLPGLIDCARPSRLATAPAWKALLEDLTDRRR